MKIIFNRKYDTLKPQFTPTPCFVTLPRKARREIPGGQEEEVRLVPYFDGVGPRTSAKGSLDAQAALAAHQGGYILP